MGQIIKAVKHTMSFSENKKHRVFKGKNGKK
jgi:hypothetical protein